MIAGPSPSGERVAPETLPRTVAVLPFVSEPDKEEQARVMTRMLHGAMGATSSFELVRPYVVDERLVRLGLTDPKGARGEEPDRARTAPERRGSRLR